MKSYTDIEQSKKLAEILPTESADMCYIKHSSSYNPTWRFDNDLPPMVLSRTPIDKITVQTLPCWSLAALLEVIPKYIKDHYVLRMDYNKDFSIWYDEVGCGVSIELPDITKDSAIDACYEMILELYELKLI